MKILLADDHELVRDGTRITLQRFDKDLSIIEATNFNDLIQSLDEHQDFDLILLDLTMPGMEGLDAIKQIRILSPATPIVVVSASEDPHTIQESLQQGVQGYITKTSSKEVIMSALHIVMAGSIYIPPAILKGLTKQFNYDKERNREQNRDIDLSDNIKKRLTQRQCDVLSLLKEGKTNREIGASLGMSEATVRTHLTAAYKVLNVTNRTQAVHILNRAVMNF